MTSTKPWYLSRTIWASLVTVATAAGGVLGLPTGGIDNAALTDTLLQAIAAISGLVDLRPAAGDGEDRIGRAAFNLACIHVEIRSGSLYVSPT